ncbi:FHA domain-containing protein [Agromyces sp. CFH 90414]|uniref:FHA domain-containing protein n=1 Tax=Agromyces agglutinans TaxID=2662258 RepID=A0A6I2FAA6_9MICO|nr:DUF5684 domain-containing protein [Agromyces agglutinans]MRG58883.1 FHA domain-containing protein [Agromyces agglutinans]
MSVLAVDGSGVVPDVSALGPALFAMVAAAFVVWLALYLWTGFALSRLFARTGGEPWKAWVPVLNEAEVFARGGKPAYSLVYCLIPVVAIYGLVVRIAAVHRINERFGRGAGSTALGIVLPPVWMSVLAWGPEPAPEPVGGRVPEALDEAIDPATAFAPRDASGYAIPVATPIEVQPLEPQGVVPAVPGSVLPAPGMGSEPVAAAPVAVPAAAPVRPAAVARPVAASPAPAPPAARANWRVELADGTAFDLAAPRIVLGRNPEPATPDEQRIALPDHTRTLSKTHARLAYTDGAWRLVDLASTNGSRVVDASGSVLELQPGEPAVVGERFRLGEVELRLAYELVP